METKEEKRESRNKRNSWKHNTQRRRAQQNEETHGFFFFFLGAVFLATLGTFKGELGLVFSSLVERRRLLRRVGEGEGEGDAMVKTCLGGIQL
jgi:hypothetical protein